MAKTVALIRGDGVGPELTAGLLKVLNATAAPVEFLECDAGAEWWEKNKGDSLIPEATWEVLEDADACFKGPTITPEGHKSPRSVAVSIRQHFDLYANVRPIRTCPGTPKRLGDVNFLCVRESTEGLYFGREVWVTEDMVLALRRVSRGSCRRVAKFAFEAAQARKWKTVVAIHKANILKESDGLFLEEIEAAAKKFPGVAMEEMHIDNAAQQVVKNPQKFNEKVLLSTNLFMDVLSEECSALVGSIGLIPSGNYGETYAMFEPAHGAAPKYRGQDKTNPTATILAGAMLLDYLKFPKQAREIEAATERTIADGVVTYDLNGSARTSQMADTIAARLSRK